jgi:hypothetical protein
MMKQNGLKKASKLLLCAAMLTFVACIDGYDDDKTWSSGVENATLESPAADKVKVIPGSEDMTISWGVVPGAGGYQFSLYIVDDPANPVLVGEENQIVDGISVKRPMQEDTYYKIVIKTLGNAKYNNTEASTATDIAWNNMLPVTAVIPSGTNLTDYFTANPIPASATELCYVLETGGAYTMTGDVPIGLTSVTFRGDKVNHAKITLTNGSFLNDGAGFKLQFIDIDAAAYEGKAIIFLNTALNPAVTPSKGGYLVIPTTSPITVQSCKITKLAKNLFWDNNTKYAIGTFIIKDCIIGQNTAEKIQVLRSQQSVIKDLTLMNSTFYNEKTNEGYFIQLQGTQVTKVEPNEETWANANLKITNCTFWQIVKGDQMGNYANNFAQKGNTITIQKSIFVDCGNKAVVRRLGGGNGNATVVCGYNSYWFDGAFVASELTTTPADNSGTAIETDPQYTNPAGGDFTPQGAAQIANKTGDPRWLDATIWR